jgi:hypothetical protein
MKSNILLVFLMAFVFYCHRLTDQNATNDINQFVKIETEKWKKELLLNGEIGMPCDPNNQEEWAKNNPDVFYGLPDSINIKLFDVNNDKINDVLLYFPAGDCCSCTIGVNEASDFVKLIYSDGPNFLENNNLQKKIESKIEGEFYSQTNTDVEKVIFSITDFKSEITGNYKLWTLEDPDCCAGFEGTFKYNPFTWKMELKQQKAQ